MWSACIILCALSPSPAQIKFDKVKNAGMQHRPAEDTSAEPRYQILNINNLWTWVESNGESNHSPQGQSGMYYPRGTSWVVYKDGIKWGGKCYVDAEYTRPAPYGQLIRVGGNDYGSGTRQGWIEGFGAGASRVDPDHPDARMFRIRRDYASMTDELLRRDASEFFEIPISDVTEADMQAVYDQYEKDWQEWPVDRGAPFIDRNGNGLYDPPPTFSGSFTADDLMPGNYDEPGIAGCAGALPADQVLWNVFNDLDRNMTTVLYGSEPMGLELQRTVWGYERTDALGDVFFKRLRMINKGGVDVDGAGGPGSFYIDSMYVAQWSDPDVGFNVDDLVGCDTVLDVGFAYNDNYQDKEYDRFNLAPPALGYDILQGAAILSPGSTGVINFKEKKDVKNLGMTAFVYVRPSGPLVDPSNGYPNTLCWYRMMQGYYPEFHAPMRYYPFPAGMEPGPFVLSGDPVAGSGFLDGLGEVYSRVAGDRRFLCSSGPFSMAPGDTQEVIIAVVCGIGADRLSSVSVMKFNDRYAQCMYDRFFRMPGPPMRPQVKVTELDGRVVLEWGSDAESVAETESIPGPSSGYAFEGYNVYQFPRANSALSEAERIATFDLPSDPAVIVEEYVDETLGCVLTRAVQFGTNSGIHRYFEFDRDYLLNIDKIYNGQEYYLAVTAYSCCTVYGHLPAAQESEPEIITVIPHREKMGERNGSSFSDTLSVIHASGTGDAAVYPIVVDPEAIVPAEYTIEFDTAQCWSVWREGVLVSSENTNYSLDEDYPIVDGIMVKVGDVDFSELLDFHDYSVCPAPHEANFDISSYGWEGWGDALALETRGLGTTDIELLQCDIELRFTGEYETEDDKIIRIKEGTGSVATFVGARYYGLDEHPMNPVPGSLEPFPIRIPFEVWDVDRDMQINILIYDRIQKPDDVPFYAFNPYYRIYAWLNAKPYQEMVITETDEAYNTWNLVFWRAEWQKGDTVTIRYTNPIFPGVDRFTYSTYGFEPTLDAETAKQDIDRIGVFPNPYYAFNQAETSRLDRFVTFNNLPDRAVIRIFNLAGQLVQKLEKADASPFLRWDLRNRRNDFVASGMYIAHVRVDLPTGGSADKVLKLAVIQEE